MGRGEAVGAGPAPAASVSRYTLEPDGPPARPGVHQAHVSANEHPAGSSHRPIRASGAQTRHDSAQDPRIWRIQDPSLVVTVVWRTRRGQRFPGRHTASRALAHNHRSRAENHRRAPGLDAGDPPGAPRWLRATARRRSASARARTVHRGAVGDGIDGAQPSRAAHVPQPAPVSGSTSRRGKSGSGAVTRPGSPALAPQASCSRTGGPPVPSAP